LYAIAGADKGWAADVRQMARELRVRYVLDGSVRKGADRIHVTARLVDAEIDGLRKAG
jgi:adenylate cyclase